MQEVRSGEFQRMDWGEALNQAKYGQITPLLYDTRTLLVHSTSSTRRYLYQYLHFAARGVANKLITSAFTTVVFFLGKINVPVALFSSAGDWFADAEDVGWLASALEREYRYSNAGRM